MRWRGMVTALGIVLLSAQAARGELQAPQNVNVEPTTPKSAERASRAATAEMKGNPQEAVQLADHAIRSDPRNAWAYYDKGMALAEMRETDGALAALYAAEQHFPAADKWGRSVAIYGRAHVLSQA